ncbi:hypothetical protein [Nodosilinea sp. P-1105]|uniref:hypothetical protein n=1 Tax=Nodosilinea sp. P-1105 TaxID=2546229 RepID=UPI00146EC0D0|nr:hypothetical protein [Nodosilinea sp. P-1105]NMF83631.1 hypothetical protein [Nodosilinea sp. P-1105]
MYTSYKSIFLPLLIALGSTGLAEAAIARDASSNKLADLANELQRPTIEQLLNLPPTHDVSPPNDNSSPEEQSSPRFWTPAENSSQRLYRTIFADGSEFRINLSGRPGAAASPPSPTQQRNFHDPARIQRRLTGEEPEQPQSVQPIHGSSGGPGGDGGVLTVYYTDLDNLRQVYVDASGGRGGAGSQGIDGFTCPPPPLETPEVTSPEINLPALNSPETNLEDLFPPSPSFEPPSDINIDDILSPPAIPQSDGDLPEQSLAKELKSSAPLTAQTVNPFPISRSIPSGCRRVSARSGGRGRDGNVGHLRLVNQQEPLPLERSRVATTLSELTSQTFELSKHVWRERRGAADLLAPGSIIADTYLEFVERLEATAQLDWQADPPIEEFADQPASLSLEDDGRISLSLTEDLWPLTETQYQDELATVIVQDFIPADEVTELAPGLMGRDGNSLTFSVIDLAGHSEVLYTDFHIRYRSGISHSSRPRWQTRYEGEIPAELVTRDHNRFVIDLSQLPIEAQYQRSGTPVNIEITATRSLGDRAKTQTLRWQDQLR